jgi:hypothetical protein
LAWGGSNWTAISQWAKALLEHKAEACGMATEYRVYCIETFSSVVTRKCSLIPWKIWWTSAYTSRSDEGASLLFQSVLSNRSTSLVSDATLDGLESEGWIDLRSPFGLSCLLSFNPEDCSCGPDECAVCAYCSGATNESRKWRNPARFYIQCSISLGMPIQKKNTSCNQ